MIGDISMGGRIEPSRNFGAHVKRTSLAQSSLLKAPELPSTSGDRLLTHPANNRMGQANSYESPKYKHLFC